MRSRRRHGSEQQERERLAARIQSLEQRVTLLEARVRRSVLPLENARKAIAAPVRAARPRPRCPGCLLELPKGRRGETCVWCGFVFSAVGPLHPPRKKAPARRRAAGRKSG